MDLGQQQQQQDRLKTSITTGRSMPCCSFLLLAEILAIVADVVGWDHAAAVDVVGQEPCCCC